MIFNIVKNNKVVSKGNPNMLKTHTDKEIAEVYERLGFEVVIDRGVE